MNYRASIENKNFKNDPDGCATIFADGSDAPARLQDRLVHHGRPGGPLAADEEPRDLRRVRNVFDRIAPLDPLTYGQVSFNPLDYAGAIGRFYQVGLRYKFF